MAGTKNVLFIADQYLPYPSSNGACVSKVVNSGSFDGNVYVLSMLGETADSTDRSVFYCGCNRRPSPLINRLFGYSQDDAVVDALFSEADWIIREYDIDIVVCVYRPVECLLVGLKLKTKHKALCVIGYFLDNIQELQMSAKWKDIIITYNQRRLLKKLVRTYNQLIALKYYRTTFEEIVGCTQNTNYVGLPSIIQHTRYNAPVSHCDDEITVVYTGSFNPDCRRPDGILNYLCDVCDVLPKIRVHLYSWGCDELVAEAKQKMGEHLVLHGRVTLEEAQKAMESADILLNVGNDLPCAVPGKLFEYFSTGKPIINYCYRMNDGAVEDYKKYGNILIVSAQGDNRVEACVDFVQNRKQLPWERLCTTFADSLPEYTANQIMKASK